MVQEWWRDRDAPAGEREPVSASVGALEWCNEARPRTQHNQQATI
jgi:hypothetical protein